MSLSREQLADRFNADIEEARATGSVEKTADCGDWIIRSFELCGSLAEFDRWRIERLLATDAEIIECAKAAGRAYEQRSKEQRELNALMMEYINMKLDARDFPGAKETEAAQPDVQP